MIHKPQAGMTLVELLVVIMIVGILASIAAPSYRNYVIRTNRTEAKTQLLSTAASLERCYSQFRAYDSASCTVTGAMPFDSPSGNYTIDVNAGITATTFTLTATPQGEQAKDTGCGTLSLDQTNARGATGGKGAMECWSR